MVKDKKVKNKVSLRISSQITSYQEISDFLDFDPDGFNVKGSKAVPKDPKSYVFPSNMWRLDSDLDESEPLETHIARIIEFIEHREVVFKELAKTCTFNIFCGYFPDNWSGHLSLSPDLLKSLTKIPLSLIVKLYPPSSDNRKII